MSPGAQQAAKQHPGEAAHHTPGAASPHPSGVSQRVRLAGGRRTSGQAPGGGFIPRPAAVGGQHGPGPARKPQMASRILGLVKREIHRHKGAYSGKGSNGLHKTDKNVKCKSHREPS